MSEHTKPVCTYCEQAVDDERLLWLGQHLTRTACTEALRAALDQERAKVEKLAAMLARVADALDRADCSEGYCICGSPVDSHSWGDGHSPTDAGVYHKRQLLDEAAALLSGRGED